MNKPDIIIEKKQNLSKENYIQFFIETVAQNNKIIVGISGLHTIPRKTNHFISLILVVVGSDSALKDSEDLTNIMNSFHIVGE